MGKTKENQQITNSCNLLIFFLLVYFCFPFESLIFEHRLFNFVVFSLDYIEQVSQLHHYVPVIGTREVVALGIAVDVAQAEIVAALKHEMAKLAMRELQS